MRCPPELTGSAKTFWQTNAKRLQQAGLLTAHDRCALILLAQLWGRMQDGNLNDVNFVRLGKQVASLMGQFGMNPAARKRLNVETTREEPDEFGI